MHQEDCAFRARCDTPRPQISGRKRFRGSAGLSAPAVAAVLLAVFSSLGYAQGSAGCVSGGADFSNPPELRSSGGVLKGTIYLSDERQRLPTSVDENITCSEPVVRNFRLNAPKEPRDRDELLDPMPGPTLRARVGDIVQLTFVNQIDPGRFEKGLDIEECTQVNNGEVYPKLFNDIYPNCLHASSTANIHFHGTHTNPNSTGDNVYLQVRPLPRDNQGNLTTTPTDAKVGLEDFFERCSRQMKQNPLSSWPVTWDDLPKVWTDRQKALLMAHQQNFPGQQLWDKDAEMLNSGNWPIYYIGAVPYCFALPAYTAGDNIWPPPPGSSSPIMGQAPGTHWYHAHKHGSTAINVANGMTGAFIIEGKYDDDLDAAYRGYSVDGKPWDIGSQKILVLNQLGTTPNALVGGAFGLVTQSQKGIDFSVNGRLRPKLKMRPGEVQLWRILNTSGRTAAYFVPPDGAPDSLAWRQVAQDGVQFADGAYQQSLNRPLYIAPANRVDLLVQAPLNAPRKTFEIRIQNVMARSSVKPSGVDPGTVLLTVEVEGPSVLKEGQPIQMPFLEKMPDRPSFLRDIDDNELRQNNYRTRTLVFDSKGPGQPHQHTINGIQFENGFADISIELGVTEEWTIKNTTILGSLNSNIDHPLHIHINPFQVTEIFDPNEMLIDPRTGRLEVDSSGQTVARYVIDSKQLTDPGNPFAKRQCYIDPMNEATWSVGGARSVADINGTNTITGPCEPQEPSESKSIWRDVFAIPSALAIKNNNGDTVAIIPGYYKMRSRFVDYRGLYVMHCHILIHEDRGMMYSVEVVKTERHLVVHH
jgi:FtsP/CotA-like multicopper oxidase with cupredoxin domain